MKSQKTLKLYVYVDGINDVPFYGGDSGEYEEFIVLNGEQFITSSGFVFNVRNVNEQIEIGNFRFDAKRMGGAPIITFTLMYEECLDKFWNENIYATFNGEKYFLKQTPTSSLSNEDERYKHDVELVSERAILDNVYFVDAVSDNTSEDKPLSNSTKVVFFGNIEEFAERLNKTLVHAKLQGTTTNEEGETVITGWKVVVDEGVTSEEKLVSFEDAFFSNAIQESYNTYEIPYYFRGKEIHFGYTDTVLSDVFQYGVDDALLSITKSNANFKIVNRATGVGSADNIPFYYPNNSPKGDLAVDTNSSTAKFTIIDGNAFANEVNIGDVITYSSGRVSGGSTRVSDDGSKWEDYNGEDLNVSLVNMKPSQKWFNYTFNVDEEGSVKVSGKVIIDGTDIRDLSDFLAFAELRNRHGSQSVAIDGDYIDCGRLDVGSHTLKVGLSFGYLGRSEYTASVQFVEGIASGWYNETQKKDTSLVKMGLSYSGSLSDGMTISQRIEKYVNTSQNLMPSIYRKSYGKERFYNATNNTYEGITFNNPYIEGKPREHLITVEDIKPTIEKTEVIQPEGSAFAGSSLRIDMFSEFAYDTNDNDETYEDEEGNVYFKHPYFYGKLRVMDFNLFDHAIENQPMTISFTSGDCGACSFEIGVTEEYPQKNPVQVDDYGNLLRDENGMIIAGVEGTQQQVTTFQERQQDTSKYEVWIALRKEEETYGILMPKAPKVNDAGEQIEAGHRPRPCSFGNNDGDTFVILGINLPLSYITNAEKRLEDEIIKYMKENNDEKFKFSISFSRIFFEENPNILENLDENSRIKIAYDKDAEGKDKIYTLYVTSFSYYMEQDGVLPEVRVELDDTLTISQNALQNAINEVKSQFGKQLANVDVLALSNPFFLRKDTDDAANGVIDFKKGIKFGEGGKVEVMDNNSAKLTIEYLEVTKKASFTSLEIQERTHIGGQFIISPAAIICGEVEEHDDFYRCYFQTKDEEGEVIFNQFTEKDQAICQTFNAWGSRYYWRLVVGVGEDYIDLSKTDCDEYSDAPMAGDKIIQLGNREDTTRQSAQVLSSYGANSPSFIMYNGINGFTLEGKNITGIIWNPEKQEPQMYSYGSFFFGNGETDENGNLIGDNYITYQKRSDDTAKALYINANVTLGKDSSGLTNLSDWNQFKDEYDTFVEDIDNEIQGIYNQIDGVVDSYFIEGTPTITNAPVVDWLAESETDDYALINHIGDTYTNISEYKDADGNIIDENAGKSWRWCDCPTGTSGGNTESVAVNRVTVGTWHKVGQIDLTNDYKYYQIKLPSRTWTKLNDFSVDTEYLLVTGPPVYFKVSSEDGSVYVLDDYNYMNHYSENSYIRFISSVADENVIEVQDQQGNKRFLHWHPISDSDAIKALQLAMQAQDTADGKRRVFTTIPTPPYDEGDLWAQGTWGDLMVCSTPKGEGEGYDASDWVKASKYTDDTKAQEALDAAADALGKANKANDSIEELIDTTLPAFKDGVITESEKKAIEKYINIVEKEQASINATYEKLSSNEFLPSSNKKALETAYDYVISAIKTLLATIAGAISETPTYTPTQVDSAYNTYQAAYADYSSAIEDAYAAIEKVIDEKAEKAKQDAELAKAAAEKAEAATNALNDDNIFAIPEKRSMREKLKEINPSEGASVMIYEWLITNREDLSGYPWTKITDTKDANYGWYASNIEGITNGRTITKVYLQVNRKCNITVHIMSRAESTFDYTLLSLLDNTLAEGSSSGSSIVAAHTSGKQGEDVSYTFENVEAGTHFFTIMYRKDNSNDESLDRGYYKIESDDGYGVFTEGNLGDYLKIMSSKGIDDTEGDNAIDAANNLFSYLYAAEVWGGQNTSLNDGSYFRDRVYNLFQNYYKEIANLIQITAISDANYLMEAFKDSRGILSGGLMLGEFIGVGDTTTVDNVEETYIEAAMNGSDMAKDETHGKMLLALGIEPPTYDDSGIETETLEERMSKANTRIYADGTIVVDAPEVEGKVVLTDNGLTYVDTDTDFIRAAMGGTCVGASGAFYAREVNPSEAVCTSAALLAVGSTDTPAAFFSGNTETKGTSKVSKLEVSDPILLTQGITIDPTSGFSCEKGVFAGLRPALVKTATNQTLQMDNLNHTIISVNGTLSLPSTPKNGQEYKILHTTVNLLTIKNNSTSTVNILEFKDTTNKVASITSNVKETIEMVYCSSDSTWYVSRY